MSEARCSKYYAIAYVSVDVVRYLELPCTICDRSSLKCKLHSDSSGFCFCVVFRTVVAVQLSSLRFNGQIQDSTVWDAFHPLNDTENGPTPSLTTRDRELVSVLEVTLEPGDLNPRPLTPQSVTLPTLPRAACLTYSRRLWDVLGLLHYRATDLRIN